MARRKSSAEVRIAPIWRMVARPDGPRWATVSVVQPDGARPAALKAWVSWARESVVDHSGEPARPQ